MASHRSAIFTSLGHNTEALKNTAMDKYLEQFPTPAALLDELKKQGLADKIDQLPNTPYIPFIQCPQTASEIINKDLSEMSSGMPFDFKPSDLRQLPASFQDLMDKTEFYIDVLCDLLKNQLAKRGYEPGIPDQENVSELNHALQAAKIGHFLHGCTGEVLALLLHDIARLLKKDQEYGHVNHAREGSIILWPLGTTDYAGFHGLAKHLLFRFCPLYQQNLISPVSRYSLKKQQIWDEFFHQLNDYAPAEFFTFIYKIMFMRLIDDMSKVPDLLLNKTVTYFNDLQIKQMITSQIGSHLKANLLCKDTSEQNDWLKTYEEKLDQALHLMLPAKEFTYHSELYEDQRAQKVIASLSAALTTRPI